MQRYASYAKKNELSTDKGCGNHHFNAFHWNEWNMAQVVAKQPRPPP